MLRVLRALSFVFAAGILAVVGSAVTPTRAAAQVCQQVVTGNGILPPTDHCHTPPVIRATPSNGTYNGKSLHVLVQYCHAYVNIDASSYSLSLNSVDLSTTFPDRQPDTLPTSGFCGAPPKGSQTAEAELFLTLKPGANTVETSICTDYDFCADSTFHYTYAPLFPVAVTPDDSATRVYASQAGSQVFVIKRLDSDTALGTYNLTKSCTGAALAGGCTISPSSVNLRGGGTANATVSYTTAADSTTGRIVVTAVLSTNSAMTDSGSKNLTSSAPGVTITPKNVAGNAAPSAPNTAFFTVTNTGPVSATFNFSTGCTGSETSCSAVPTSQAIAGGATFTATIRYTAGALTTTGVVKLLGVHSTIPSVKDSGYYNITSATPGAIVVADQSAGSTLERSLCLTVAAGHGAATECGDLRLAHAMPGVRTKNKARTPTLLYNSAHAHPYPTFPFSLALPSGAPVPDSVTASLTIGGVTRATGKWTGSDFYTAGTRRAVLAFDALSDTTAVYSYSMQAKSWYGTTSYSSSVVNGEYALVNRSGSNFGAGWWMAGLEQLKILGDGSLLWMDGDGSTRHYASAGTNIWAAPKVDRPDTVKFSGTYYTRYAEHGLHVIFDNTGNHVYTVNRVSDTTMFKYTARRLDTIIVAPMSAAKKFVFSYDAGSPQRLTSVAAPTLPGKTRNTTVTTSGGRITSIREPDSTLVSFGYTANDTNRITSRTDRRGTVGTFTFNAQKKLVKDSIGMDVGDATIVTQFRPYETVGVSPSSIDTTFAYGLIDGPRTDVGDTTLFWLDKFGAPRKIRNALGADTKLDRTDPNYPALVSRVLAPNGRITRAFYDARGNDSISMDSSSCNGGGCATSTYVWDKKWDFATLVRSPLGEKTRMSYDATTGNRLWQQPDSDSTYTARRVTYTYDGTSKLLIAVQQPVVTAPDRVWYDAMGNPDSTQSPSGIKNYFYKDALGRDTLSKSPADLTSATWVLSQVWFNVADEDSVAKTWSPGHPDTITVIKTFDPEGNVLTHTSYVYPDSSHLGGMSHLFTYDRANRKTAEQPQGQLNGTDHFVYDGAGNVTTWTPRSSTGVVTTYDALNRPVMKILASMSIGSLQNYSFGTATPVDTQTFVYDIAGNMLQANNLYARVSRAWNQNGTLAADTERVRASLASDPSFPKIYGTRYGYDIEGRRIWMKYPATIAASGDDSAAYSYDATTGALSAVRDPYGHRFSYAYDNALRIASDTGLAESGSPMINTRTYDNESRVVADTMTRSGTHISTYSITYSERSSILSATFYTPNTGGSPVMKYHPLGPLTKSSDVGVFNDSTITDALGNMRGKLHYWSTTDITSATYDSVSAMLVQTILMHGGGSPTPDTTQYAYDLAGSVWTTTNLKFLKDSSCGGVCNDHLYNRVITNMRYGPDLKLMASDTHMDEYDERTRVVIGTSTYDEREEYRYDALGRRVWTRLVRPDLYCPLMDKPSGCLSTVERTVWDGDNVLAEIRADGGDATSGAQRDCDVTCNLARQRLEGRVLYTVGGGLDHPLDVIDLDGYNGEVIVPIDSWRGRAVDGVCVNGSTFCTDFAWPARTESALYESAPTDPNFGGPVAWAGNIIDTQQDGSGLIYKRNRYYDPASGRFTQVDPIGLGGGLSAYGFGGGDQISYDDPFGLCPDACVVEGGVVIAAAAVGTVVFLTAVAKHKELGESFDEAGKAVGAMIGGALAAVSDKIHEAHLAGQASNIETHFNDLAGGGGPGKDPNKWGEKWKKDIAKGIRLMKERVGRLASDADRAKWEKVIEGFEQRLQNVK